MSSVYWVAGAALGLAEGYAYALEQLCPGGARLTRIVGLSGAKKDVRALCSDCLLWACMLIGRGCTVLPRACGTACCALSCVAHAAREHTNRRCASHSHLQTHPLTTTSPRQQNDQQSNSHQQHAAEAPDAFPSSYRSNGAKPPERESEGDDTAAGACVGWVGGPAFELTTRTCKTCKEACQSGPPARRALSTHNQHPSPPPHNAHNNRNHRNNTRLHPPRRRPGAPPNPPPPPQQLPRRRPSPLRLRHLHPRRPRGPARRVRRRGGAGAAAAAARGGAGRGVWGRGASGAQAKAGGRRRGGAAGRGQRHGETLARCGWVQRLSAVLGACSPFTADLMRTNQKPHPTPPRLHHAALPGPPHRQPRRAALPQRQPPHGAEHQPLQPGL